MTVLSATSREVEPSYGTTYSAGFDIRSAETKWIWPLFSRLFKTGLTIGIPVETEVCILILGRSGMTRKGILLHGGTGLIDIDYHGEFLVNLCNRTWLPYKVNKGDRIAQGIFLPIKRGSISIANALGGFGDVWPITRHQKARGSNGHGSTGV